MGPCSGWPVGRIGHVPVEVAHMDVGRISLVGVDRRIISYGVVVDSLVYPLYVLISFNSYFKHS